MCRFFLCRSTFPVGLGFPDLSDEAIDSLISEKYYAKTAETITTLADAVALYQRMGLKLDRSLRDPGDGRMTYSRSGWRLPPERWQ